MAVYPLFVVSPNTIVSLIGYMRGPDKTIAVPTEDYRQAKVDVVIPCLNEERNITLALASIARQTMQPRQIILVDDGSLDRTVEFAQEFSRINGIELRAIRRKQPIGKTPTIKRQAREFDSDVEFILDADTVLDSDNYIERTVEELYKAVGIASACGIIMPQRRRDRERFGRTTSMQRFLVNHPEGRVFEERSGLRRFLRGITNLYRETLYMYLQRFIYRGQMTFFGSISGPIGCAVAYRRQYVENLFDKYEPIMGDDLTNSEDVFLGLASLNEGHRNIQLQDVVARTEEPEFQRLHKQLYLWSSAFLQSAFYFDALMWSPFKSLRRLVNGDWRRNRPRSFDEKRRVAEPYRQAFGEEITKRRGRPMGWVLLMGVVEKLFFPAFIIIMIALGLWEALIVTIVAEILLASTLLAISAPGQRVEYFLKCILITPIRYATLMLDFVTALRFAADLWIFGNRKWRK
ncbi:MAG TPA: glycosyltransferase [Gemmatimonadota bacterium]|nr:glycosyltransferase [Gemmatimonadota bacterium]